MSVRAKFYCQKVNRHEDSPTASGVQLGAVCRGKENAGWASATPSGSIQMGVLNEAATGYFEEGAEYLVTFTKVDKPTAGDGHQPKPVDSYGKTMCAFCGVYRDEDGTWAAHEHHYGA